MSAEEDEDGAFVRDRDGELVPVLAVDRGPCRHGRPLAVDGTPACTTCALDAARGHHVAMPASWWEQVRAKVSVRETHISRGQSQ